jgi:imidazole glycerol phosphate synthase glutamine amidotransferase subunit
MISAVELVDVGGGNLGSVKRCLERLNVAYRVADQDNPPTGDRPLVVPGVGAFGPVMEHLAKEKLDKRLTSLAKSGTPFLGICVGMQILFDGSEEAKGVRGLGLLPGKVLKFQSGKVPQIGWNRIEGRAAEANDTGYVYFVNSFYPKPDNDEQVLYYANYHVRFCAAVQWQNITAFQFHPEKSGKFGQSLLSGWLANAG